MTHAPVHRFPPGLFTLAPHQAWLWNDAVQGPGNLAVHPGTACMVALCGSGASVADVMAHLRTPAHRVVFGELGFSFHGDIKPGQPLRVETRIDAIERKHGKRMPVFDRVALCYELCDDQTQKPLVEVRQVWIVDRTGENTTAEEAKA